MNLNAYIHDNSNTNTTISEIKRIHEKVSTQEFFGLYAYATQSGVSMFELALGEDFWEPLLSRWVFGIDYGRTHPQALRKMSSHKNAEIKIYDGAWVVDQKGFLPRRDFHSKMAFLLGETSENSGIVVGSGNFSSNGLSRSVEAGVALIANENSVFDQVIRPTLSLANTIWEKATPLEEIIDVYEERWSTAFFRNVIEEHDDVVVDGTTYYDKEIFWIEAGYVTKNRGPLKPGNQIDFPRGMSMYFGFNPPSNLPANTVIGEIVFETPTGEEIIRNLRLGNNMMEKITLPIPDTSGFDIYDGKVLVFQRLADRFLLKALELEDFETAFGDTLAEVRVMGSGRRYGHIA